MIFYVLNILFPPEGLGQFEETDLYGTFTAREAAKLGIEPMDEARVLDNSPFVTQEADGKQE